MNHPQARYEAATADWWTAREARERAALQRAYALADWHAQGVPVPDIAHRIGLSPKRVHEMIERARKETP